MRATWLIVLVCFCSLVCAKSGQKKVLVPKPERVYTYPPTAPGDPLVTADAAIIIEADSGRVLWERNATKHMFPASTTKILTTLLWLENTKPTDMVTAPADVQKVGEASLHLVPGERLNAHDLALGMMVRSANDGCYTAAIHLAGSQEKFAEMMNDRAQKLGCTDSHFVTPNGLHDPNHYTCAADLAKIAREAMKRADFRDLARTSDCIIDRSIDKLDTILKSKNHMLLTDPTCEGIKTGYTRPAGSCFVGAATRNGWRVICVVLFSQNWPVDYPPLMDWAFSRFDPPRSLVTQGQRFAVETDNGPIPAEAESEFKIATRKGSEPKFIVQPAKNGPFEAHQLIGNVIILDGEKEIGRIPLRSTQPSHLSSFASMEPATSRFVLPACALAMVGVIIAIVRSFRKA